MVNPCSKHKELFTQMSLEPLILAPPCELHQTVKEPLGAPRSRSWKEMTIKSDYNLGPTKTSKDPTIKLACQYKFGTATDKFTSHLNCQKNGLIICPTSGRILANRQQRFNS
ncbi:hypothetical protein T265_01205 [Opisthorchis viverrini]|uniref:Uncharacterized protein n=1 Tax=Opisthorchis viverrini TaxID=6198 RepID=A0A075AAD7_OPIVI|nr:hypothetical protein T265_01205 [Opisthorchis viverrini]KER32715.1 hypothetical protein T265_01205 [Opisthorchis viverrini]